VVIASVNFICHFFSIFDLHWQLPYNGIKTPNIRKYRNHKQNFQNFVADIKLLSKKNHIKNDPY